MQDYTDGDLVTCLWKLQGDKEIVVASAYMDITLQEVASSTLEKLLDYCSQKNLELMLCADSNAHSSMWGCEETNRRGEVIEEILVTHGLEVKNTGNQFTFYRANCRTIIDITLTRGPTLAEAVKDWRVTDQVQGSDHLMLEWRLTISATSSYKARNWNKGDWILFQSSLEEKCGTPPKTWTRERLDEAAITLDMDLESALDKSHPKHVTKVRVRALPNIA